MPPSPRRLDWTREGPTWPHHRHSRFVDAGGVRFHVQVLGQGEVALLLHGTGASTHSMRALMTLLAPRFTVVAPDLPGHGFSTPGPRFVPSLASMSEALRALLEALCLRPGLAVGHSAGAAVLARMALDRVIAPRLIAGVGAAMVPFRGLGTALFAPAARLLAPSLLAAEVVAFRARDRASIARLVAGTGSRLDDEGLDLYRRLASHPGHVAAVLAMMAAWDLEPLLAALPRLPVPLLLVAGALDRAVPLARQREVAERVPGARLVVLPDCGHLLHEERPDEVARLILDEYDRLA